MKFDIEGSVAFCGVIVKGDYAIIETRNFITIIISNSYEHVGKIALS
jgi:hypothetical protein